MPTIPQLHALAQAHQAKKLSATQRENIGAALDAVNRPSPARDDRRYELTKLAWLKLMDSEEVFTPSGLALAALEQADALIAELDKEVTP